MFQAERNAPSRRKRRLVAGLFLSVVAHFVLLASMGAAPRTAPASGAMTLAMTFVAPPGDATETPEAHAVPDPPPVELPPKEPEPVQPEATPQPPVTTPPVTKPVTTPPVTKPDPPRLITLKPPKLAPKSTQYARTVPPVETPPKVERETVEKPAAVQPPPPPRMKPRPVKAQPKKKPRRKVVVKKAKRKPAPPKRTAAKKIKAKPAQTAMAPVKAKELREKPQESTSKMPGEGTSIGGGARFPMMTRVRFMRRPTPANYPRLSRQREEEGLVVIRALVGMDGHPSRIQVWKSSGYPRLDQAALTAVKGWRFMPAKRGGQPTPAWVQIPLAFRLQ